MVKLNSKKTRYLMLYCVKKSFIGLTPALILTHTYVLSMMSFT